MPYIECPNGKTYSRYDNSPYVVWCIKHEDSMERANYLACTLDPVCKAKRDKRDQRDILIIKGLIILVVFVIAVVLYNIFKDDA